MFIWPLWLGMTLVAAVPFPETTQFDSKPQLLPLGDEPLAVAYSPDGNLLAVGCADGAVRLYDPSTSRLLATLSGHGDAVAAVAFSRDGARLASGSYDKTIRVWDVVSHKETGKFTGHTNAVLAVAF